MAPTIQTKKQAQEPCYACDGTGAFSDIILAGPLEGTTVRGSCAVCRGTGKVSCICREGAEFHYITCPSRLPLEA